MSKKSNVAAMLVLAALVLTPQVSHSMSVDQMVQRGWSAREAERYGEAETLLRGAIQRDPKNVSALLGLGLVMQDKGQLDPAIALLRQALQVAPNNPGAQSALKNALSQKARSQQFQSEKTKSLKTQLQAFEQAIQAQDRAIATLVQITRSSPNRPSSYEAYIELGNTLLKRNRTGEERLLLLRAIQQVEPGYTSQNIEANAFVNEEKRLNDAIASYQRAIALNSNLPEAHYGLGNALYDQNRMRDAITAYQQAVKLNPQDVFAQSKLERAKQRLERQSKR